MNAQDDGHYDEAKLRRRRFMKYAGLGIGATAVVFPAGYILWRARGVRVSLPKRIPKSNVPPPPRRASLPMRSGPAMTEATAISTGGGGAPNAEPLPTQSLVRSYISEEGITNFMPSMEDITSSNVWLAFKSFVIATMGVTAFAGVTVSFVIWKWDIQNLPDFNQRMHALIGSILPNLSSKVHRPFKPSQHDIESSGPEMSTMIQSFSEESIEKWTWEEAKLRMSEAYDRGGPVAWTAAMVREMELGNQQELRKQEVVSKKQ